MLRRNLVLVAIAGAALGLSIPAQAIVEDYVWTYDPWVYVPDNNPNGLAISKTIANSKITCITKITVDLKVKGLKNGDLVVALIDPTGDYSVLMNRVGKNSSSSRGYYDDGVDIIFDDAAANGDIHTYQTVVNPGGGKLTGTWMPDARAVDPTTVTNSSPRTNFLSIHNGIAVNGQWTLYIADRGSSYYNKLQRWSLHFEGVPEPGSVIVVITGMTAFLALRRRR